MIPLNSCRISIDSETNIERAGLERNSLEQEIVDRASLKQLSTIYDNDVLQGISLTNLGTNVVTNVINMQVLPPGEGRSSQGVSTRR